MLELSSEKTRMSTLLGNPGPALKTNKSWIRNEFAQLLAMAPNWCRTSVLCTCSEVFDITVKMSKLVHIQGHVDRAEQIYSRDKSETTSVLRMNSKRHPVTFAVPHHSGIEEKHLLTRSYATTAFV